MGPSGLAFYAQNPVIRVPGISGSLITGFAIQCQSAPSAPINTLTLSVGGGAWGPKSCNQASADLRKPDYRIFEGKMQSHSDPKGARKKRAAFCPSEKSRICGTTHRRQANTQRRLKAEIEPNKGGRRRWLFTVANRESLRDSSRPEG